MIIETKLRVVVVTIYFDLSSDRRNSITEVFQNDAEALLFLQGQVEKFVEENEIPQQFHEYGDIIDDESARSTHRNVTEMNIIDSGEDCLVAEAYSCEWMFASVKHKYV